MSKENKNSGIGVGGLLGVSFIVLKLCKVIDWEWKWVLAPFWIPVVMLLIVLLIYAIIKIYSE